MVILWFNILKPLKSWILQEEEKNHKLRWDENQNKYIFITCNWKQFYHNIISGYVEAARLELRERSSLTPPQRSPPAPSTMLMRRWGCRWWSGHSRRVFSRNRRTLKSWRRTRWGGARRRKWSGAIRGGEALWGRLQAKGTWGELLWCRAFTIIRPNIFDWFCNVLKIHKKIWINPRTFDQFFINLMNRVSSNN